MTDGRGDSPASRPPSGRSLPGRPREAVRLLSRTAVSHGPPEGKGLERAAERVTEGRASQVIEARRAGERPGPVRAVDVTILHDTHFHGDFGPADGPNIAHYIALVRSLKEVNPGALFLGNDDDLAPSVLASVFRGEHMIETLNASPLDVNTLGNHEFDFGPTTSVSVWRRATSSG
jgi:hypothetical protein